MIDSTSCRCFHDSVTWPSIRFERTKEDERSKFDIDSKRNGRVRRNPSAFSPVTVARRVSPGMRARGNSTRGRGPSRERAPKQKQTRFQPEEFGKTIIQEKTRINPRPGVRRVSRAALPLGSRRAPGPAFYGLIRGARGPVISQMETLDSSPFY